jgi:hypothetical protein
MVGLGGVGCDHNEDPANCEKVVDDSPPRVGGEAISGLDLGDDGCDESNNPCELRHCQPNDPSKIIDCWGRRKGRRMLERGGWAGLSWARRGPSGVGSGMLTAEMDMVARANGSPIMLPTSIPRRLFCLLYSILRSDGEWSEP